MAGVEARREKREGWAAPLGPSQGFSSMRWMRWKHTSRLGGEGQWLQVDHRLLQGARGEAGKLVDGGLARGVPWRREKWLDSEQCFGRQSKQDLPVDLRLKCGKQMLPDSHFIQEKLGEKAE